LKLFLESHDWYAAWEAAWLRISLFHGMLALRKAIGQFKQQTRKLMCNAVKYLLLTLFMALKDPLKGKAEKFNRALTCVRYLVDFALLTQYKIHTYDTIKLLDTYLEGFHRHKDVFANFRTGKSVRAFAQSQAEIVKKRLKEDFQEVKQDGKLKIQASDLMQNWHNELKE